MKREILLLLTGMWIIHLGCATGSQKTVAIREPASTPAPGPSTGAEPQRAPSRTRAKFEQAYSLLTASAAQPKAVREEEALHLLEEIVATEPTFTPALLNLAILYDRRGDDLRAENFYRRAFESNPADVTACTYLASFLHQQRRGVRAREILENCLAKAKGQKGFDSYYLLMELHIEAGDHRQALEAAKAILLERPEDAVALLWMGRAYLRAGRYFEAKAILERALRGIGNKRAWVLHDLGTSAWHLGEETEAIGYWQEAVKADSRFEPPYRSLTELALAAGDFQKAKAMTEQLIALNPRESDYHVLLGINLRLLGDLKGAELEYLRAIRLNSRNAHAYLDLAFLYGKVLKDPVRGRIFLERAKALDARMVEDSGLEKSLPGKAGGRG